MCIGGKAFGFNALASINSLIDLHSATHGAAGSAQLVALGPGATGKRTNGEQERVAIRAH
jgi:hypothetical protein